MKPLEGIKVIELAEYVAEKMSLYLLKHIEKI